VVQTLWSYNPSARVEIHLYEGERYKKAQMPLRRSFIDFHIHSSYQAHCSLTKYTEKQQRPLPKMPSLSSLFGHSKPETPPCLTFHGPDSNNHFLALSPSGQQLARFSVTKDAIWRTLAPHMPPQQMCVFQRSSLSGTTTLQIHGQQIKMKQSWEGMQYGKDVNTAAGTMKWRPGSGGSEEFRDAQGVLLARGKMPGTLSKRIYPLEVFVAGDEFLLDLVLAYWVGMLDCQKAEGKEAESVAEVVNALVGG
jgi:hypothetical protein